MSNDPISASLFEMRLDDIYTKHPWLKYDISKTDFLALFLPLKYKNGKALKPEQPPEFALDRDIFLSVLVAFKQSFN